MKTLLSEIVEEKQGVVYAIAPAATVLEAIGKMNEQRIGSVLVMSGSRLEGIFTERDVLTKVVGRLDPATTPVSEVMTRELVALKPNSSVEDAMRIVTEKRIRHLPVMEDDKLLGLISSGDLTRWMVRDQQHTIDDLVSYINDWPR